MPGSKEQETKESSEKAKKRNGELIEQLSAIKRKIAPDTDKFNGALNSETKSADSFALPRDFNRKALVAEIRGELAFFDSLAQTLTAPHAALGEEKLSRTASSTTQSPATQIEKLGALVAKTLDDCKKHYKHSREELLFSLTQESGELGAKLEKLAKFEAKHKNAKPFPTTVHEDLKAHYEARRALLKEQHSQVKALTDTPANLEQAFEGIDSLGRIRAAVNLDSAERNKRLTDLETAHQQKASQMLATLKSSQLAAVAKTTQEKEHSLVSWLAELGSKISVPNHDLPDFLNSGMNAVIQILDDHPDRDPDLAAAYLFDQGEHIPLIVKTRKAIQEFQALNEVLHHQLAEPKAAKTKNQAQALRQLHQQVGSLESSLSQALQDVKAVHKQIINQYSFTLNATVEISTLEKKLAALNQNAQYQVDLGAFPSEAYDKLHSKLSTRLHFLKKKRQELAAIIEEHSDENIDADKNNLVHFFAHIEEMIKKEKALQLALGQQEADEAKSKKAYEEASNLALVTRDIANQMKKIAALVKLQEIRNENFLPAMDGISQEALKKAWNKFAEKQQRVLNQFSALNENEHSTIAEAKEVLRTAKGLEQDFRSYREIYREAEKQRRGQTEVFKLVQEMIKTVDEAITQDCDLFLMHSHERNGLESDETHLYLYKEQGDSGKLYYYKNQEKHEIQETESNREQINTVRDLFYDINLKSNGVLINNSHLDRIQKEACEALLDQAITRGHVPHRKKDRGAANRMDSETLVGLNNWRTEANLKCNHYYQLLMLGIHENDTVPHTAEDLEKLKKSYAPAMLDKELAQRILKADLPPNLFNKLAANHDVRNRGEWWRHKLHMLLVKLQQIAGIFVKTDGYSPRLFATPAAQKIHDLRKLHHQAEKKPSRPGQSGGG